MVDTGSHSVTATVGIITGLSSISGVFNVPSFNFSLTGRLKPVGVVGVVRMGMCGVGAASLVPEPDGVDIPGFHVCLNLALCRARFVGLVIPYVVRLIGAVNFTSDLALVSSVDPVFSAGPGSGMYSGCGVSPK